MLPPPDSPFQPTCLHPIVFSHSFSQLLLIHRPQPTRLPKMAVAFIPVTPSRLREHCEKMAFVHEGIVERGDISLTCILERVTGEPYRSGHRLVLSPSLLNRDRTLQLSPPLRHTSAR